MSEHIVNELTMRYLCNRSMHDSKPTIEQNKHDKNIKKDKKFYRKRIIDMTKKLMNEDTTTDETHRMDIPISMRNAFNSYVHDCIDYFKDLDRSDLLQNEYCDIDTNTKKNSPDVECKSQTYANELFMKNVCAKKSTDLDSFVSREKIQQNSKKKEDYPKKKKIKLKDPTLKDKGIEIK